MKTRTLRRILSCILAFSLVFALAACGKSEKASNNAEQGTAKENSEAASEAVKSQEKADVSNESGVLAANTDVTSEDILARDYSENLKITFAGVQVTDGLDYNNGNEYYSWWTDTFNVEWDITSLTWANWVERMNIWINADDLPDWSVWNFNPGDAANYVEQELVKKLPDDWKEKYPNLAAAASCTDANAYYEKLYGGTYFLFRPVFANNFPADTVTNHFSCFLRKDWAEQAGYDLSKNLQTGTITISEFMAYLQAVKDAGICEYPWYNTSSYVGGLIDRASEAAGVLQSAYYLGEDGKYHWGPAEEASGVKAAATIVKEAYDKGLLYPEFFTLQDPDDIGHFYASGDCAAVVYQGMAAWFDRFNQNMQSNLGVDFFDVGAVFVITDDNEVAHEDPSTNFWACNIISPNISDEKLDRLLSIWDYGCTEEGQLRIRLGVPGVDWDYDANGEIVSKIEEQGFASLEDKYTSLYPMTGNMFILSDDYSFINPSFSKTARDKVAEVYKIRAAHASSRGQEIDWNLSSYSSQALNLASMTYADEYANLITQKGDFSANYDAWVNEKLAMINPVLAELDEAFCK